MRNKLEVISRKMKIGRLLCHFNWSRDGLWYNDAGDERFFYWLYFGPAHKHGKSAFMVIIFKAKMIAGILPPLNTKES